MSKLAFFLSWNRGARLTVLSRRLAIGRTPEKIHEFEHEHMNSMTTKNYEEMGRFPNPHWIAFFVDLEEEAKVSASRWVTLGLALSAMPPITLRLVFCSLPHTLHCPLQVTCLEGMWKHTSVEEKVSRL